MAPEAPLPAALAEPDGRKVAGLNLVVNVVPGDLEQLAQLAHGEHLERITLRGAHARNVT